MSKHVYMCIKSSVSIQSLRTTTLNPLDTEYPERCTSQTSSSSLIVHWHDTSSLQHLAQESARLHTCARSGGRGKARATERWKRRSSSGPVSACARAFAHLPSLSLVIARSTADEPADSTIQPSLPPPAHCIQRSRKTRLIMTARGGHTSGNRHAARTSVQLQYRIRAREESLTRICPSAAAGLRRALGGLLPPRISLVPAVVSSLATPSPVLGLQMSDGRPVPPLSSHSPCRIILASVPPAFDSRHYIFKECLLLPSALNLRVASISQRY